MQMALDIGQRLKRDGQDAVLSANAGWTDRALATLRVWLDLPEHDKTFAIEDFRRWAITDGGLDFPSHHNAWGGLPRLAVNAGLIVWTGEYRPATSAKTHAHPVRLYVRGE